MGSEVTSQLSISTLSGIPMVKQGDDLAEIILDSLKRDELSLQSGDIVVVAQKIVSKAEGRLIRLKDVTPSEEALALASETEKDPRLVQLTLDESTKVVRQKPGILIVRHRLGHIGANAGIDQSNIEDDDEYALLLPKHPDLSAENLKRKLDIALNCDVGVLITDSHNRPWRMGTIGGAIGCAGFQVIDDRRGLSDLFGRELKVTLINRADAIAALATLLMGETTEKTPVALVRGFPVDSEYGTADDINRPIEDDLFQ
ncbi:MAG: coenzyme F420-0:L-glutamate ligase [Proteobacteria bacterium]|nr:coenzyme F420-0:L-glutamate ligase [Pseudomonadota bacterium]